MMRGDNTRTGLDRDWNGEKLRAWRLEQGLNQQQLAALLGCTHQKVSRWENGWIPSIGDAHKIVRRTRGFIRYRDMFRSMEVRYV